MINDIWKPVFHLNNETNIEVTFDGKIRKVFKVWCSHAKVEIVDISTLYLSRDRRYQTAIQVKGIGQKLINVHLLVANVFLGYQWNDTKVGVSFLNNDPQNISVDNLIIRSKREIVRLNRLLRKKGELPTGVRRRKTKFSSQIKINGKIKSLGTYKTIEEAEQAYNNALKNVL